MALIAVSGIGARKSKAERKAKKAARKQKIKTAIKKRGKILLKFNPATALSRNSFLMLVKLNVFGLANKLRTAYDNSPDKLKKFWEKIGGDFSSLKKNINIGIRHGKKKGTQSPISGIGVVPVIAAAIAAATPIVIKVTQFLKSIGVNTDELAAGAKKLVSNIIDRKIDQQAESEVSAEDGSEQMEAESEVSAEDSAEQMEVESEVSAEDSGESVEGFRRKPRMKINRFKPVMRVSHTPQIGNFA